MDKLNKLSTTGKINIFNLSLAYRELCVVHLQSFERPSSIKFLLSNVDLVIECGKPVSTLNQLLCVSHKFATLLDLFHYKSLAS